MIPNVTEASPAATVVLGRDGKSGLEVLMVRRGERGAFGGMWVFPGGRVDPGDVDPSRPDDELAAARHAAARETAEEVGVAVDETLFVPLSHWTPPLDAPRRFTTWFFLVAAPAGSEVVVDGSEIHDHRWLSPAAAIAQRDAGEMGLLAPTWVTLWTLTSAPSVEAALDAARRRSPEFFATRFMQVADGHVGLWHGDVSYGDAHDTADDNDGPRHRLWMLSSGWRYERSSNSRRPSDREL